MVSDCGRGPALADTYKDFKDLTWPNFSFEVDMEDILCFVSGVKRRSIFITSCLTNQVSGTTSISLKASNFSSMSLYFSRYPFPHNTLSLSYTIQVAKCKAVICAAELVQALIYISVQPVDESLLQPKATRAVT